MGAIAAVRRGGDRGDGGDLDGGKAWKWTCVGGNERHDHGRSSANAVRWISDKR